ncbi:nucleotidyl transferase AbiEii/AbiGii toxin family protein [Planctomycetota bacterium]
MHEAIVQMLAKYDCQRVEDTLHALREIMQEIALLGLWRSKFFEKAAFYGGTALRTLYGLDRFSEDLDFTLLAPQSNFQWNVYTTALEKELSAFGFVVRVEQRNKVVTTPIQSAFLKANTLNQLMVIDTPAALSDLIPRGQLLKIKLEVDTNPPPAFITETRYMLMPIPFAVRCLTLDNLFAGKMHAVLCRHWKTRVKGRDWYDLVWFASHHPTLNLAHLEHRMRQTGHWEVSEALTEVTFRNLLQNVIDKVDLQQACHEVEPFVKDRHALTIWSRDFFREVARQIKVI